MFVVAHRCGDFSPWSVDPVAFELVAKQNIMGAVHTEAELFISWLGHKKTEKARVPGSICGHSPSDVKRLTRPHILRFLAPTCYLPLALFWNKFFMHGLWAGNISSKLQKFVLGNYARGGQDMLRDCICPLLSQLALELSLCLLRSREPGKTPCSSVLNCQVASLSPRSAPINWRPLEFVHSNGVLY